MASISHPLILLLTILFLVPLFDSSTSADGGGSRGPFVGGWIPIKDTNDPKVVEIGAFAVNEHNKEAKESLSFQKVVNGEIQVVTGTNYNLIIAATDGSGSLASNYSAAVYDRPWQHIRELTSFKKV